MRRADRLFQIIQILRRSRQPVTADAIALELETSKRTVYRDIADLVGQRAPIRGEAGIGYILEDGFDLPPLMLTPDEVEAAVLGAQMVAARGDPALKRAAEDLVAKIAAVIPEQLRPLVLEPATRAAPSWHAVPDNVDMAEVRRCIRTGRKITLTYRDEQERETRRTVWPFAIGYYETSRLLVTWCEMRQAFRSFRTDRVTAAEFSEDRYPERPATLRARWRRLREEHWSKMKEAS
ncbi:YafY family transcriptional regulator [Phenylobacterium sp. J426]|uniref:helix-turn-helix transcriptional regulator n=1 Tax=Phenylobacterium sp. J426 TaxID=2898439 RepID=UPI0021517462|nr:YafY family protein [Phenylobacterium sp. J426]MCR5873732.1 YafY family transcriptional regulator [Phenylobacterium sp. J426]